MRAPEVGLPLLGGPRRLQRKPRIPQVREEVKPRPKPNLLKSSRGWRKEDGKNRGVGLEPDPDRSQRRVGAGYRGNRGLHENLWPGQANGVSSEQCQLSAPARDQECAQCPTKAGRGRLAPTIEHFWLEPELDRSAVALLFWDALSYSQ